MFRVADTVGGGMLRAVRRYFGLSQLDLVPFLGIDQAELARAESGARPLPQRAGAALSYLRSCMPAPDVSTAPPELPATPPSPAPPAVWPPADAVDPLDVTALQLRQQQCAVQAGRARRQLTQMRERAAQARHRLTALPALRAAIGSAPATTGRGAADHERQRLWLALFENEAHLELGRSGATAQALLALRLGALEHEMAAATTFL